MKQQIIYFLRKIRAVLMRLLKPKFLYLLSDSTMPLSRHYGFDRGLPIDRYYIEKFLDKNRKYIKGRCLEIHDSAYINKFGANKVTHIDVLDIDLKNDQANIKGDLRSIPQIKSNSYDCLIITQTYGVIDDYEAAIRESVRILRPGGVLLATWSSVAPAWDLKFNYWRFTKASGEFVFGKYFKAAKLEIGTYGNALSGSRFLVGFSANEISQKKLDHNDPHFPLIVGIVAKK